MLRTSARLRRLAASDTGRAGEVSRAAGRGPRPGPAVDGAMPGGPVDVAVMLDLLDAACTAGLGVPGALDAVGRAVAGDRGAALVRTARSLTFGAPWEEAWPDGAWTLPLTDALRPTWDDGVPPAGALRAASATVRRQRNAAALEAAGRLGVRLVLPLGLCYLPAFVVVGLVPVLLSLAEASVG